MWTLTEARVIIEDWRWKYNHVRPHRSLGYITPNEFTQDEVGEEAKSQCRAFGRATPSLRPSIDLLYDIEQIINPSSALTPYFRTTGLGGNCAPKMVRKGAYKWEENEEYSQTSSRPRWRWRRSRG